MCVWQEFISNGRNTAAAVATVPQASHHHHLHHQHYLPTTASTSGTATTTTPLFPVMAASAVLEPNLRGFSHPSLGLRKRKAPPPGDASNDGYSKSDYHHSTPNKRSAPDSGFASIYSQCALVSDESLNNGSSQSSPLLDTASTSSTSSSGLVALSTSSSLAQQKIQSNKSLKYVGAHVSVVNGGPQRAIQQALDIGARSFALFVRSARRWTAAPLSDDAVRKFKEKLAKSSILQDKIVCHGSYLINLGAPSADVLNKSRVSLVDELTRCDRLGIKYYNIHPGSTCGKSKVDECITRIVESIQEGLAKTRTVTLLLETMCRQGYTVGGSLAELKEIIQRVDSLGYGARLGVCLDTCHVYAAGNNIACRDGWEKYMKEFEEEIGLGRLKAVHLNDSELPVGSHLDKHAAIGNGWIGIEGFKLVMNDSRLNNLPMILETNDTMYRHEIDTLYSLCQD
ncbi:DNA-(apurinic or apyrimidinic site) lyase [Hypsibius exemplaris]|uniref:DNA-(Apurinic or apyrimidinic site) lyase n=1 Tax=Hypsibius exemplaris TaxID=2072580 RepID=A0A1W0WHW7_HYPEX|nr:DNA-(apurinic or apyrimidinic site) lyase [Hypsibius exemplaris]